LGEDPAPIRGRGSPRVVPIVPLVDLVEDLVNEEQDEVPAAEPALTNFMTSPGFHDVMGRMLRFMDSMSQACLFLADPATSQAGGGAQTPTA